MTKFLQSARGQKWVAFALVMAACLTLSQGASATVTLPDIGIDIGAYITAYGEWLGENLGYVIGLTIVFVGFGIAISMLRRARS